MRVQGRNGPRRLRRVGLALMVAGTALLVWPPLTPADLIAVTAVVGPIGLAALALSRAVARSRDGSRYRAQTSRATSTAAARTVPSSPPTIAAARYDG
jgi:hypothetical protein